MLRAPLATLLKWVPWLLIAYVVFVLPWYFPPKHRLNSESYTFGFSNVAAQLGLALGLALLLALRLRDSRAVAADRWLEAAFSNPTAVSGASKQWAWVLIALVTIVVGGWWCFLPFAYFGEAAYFLTKLDRMVMGQIPYRDFEFGYGPLMLYGPYWLHRLSGRLLAIDSAYIVNLLSHYALAIAAIEYITRNFGISARWRICTLAFAVLATVNITMGILYTPLRFIFPLWAVFFLHWKLQRLGSAKLLWTLIIPAVGFGISPECGIVTFLATMTSIIWRWREHKFQIVPPLLAVVASLVATWLLFGPAYFKMIGLFGGGAFNFPILPTPYMIGLLIVTCALLPRIAVGAIRGDGAPSALLASLLVAAGLYLPAALGRCDPGHVLFNGLGLLLLATGLGAQTARFGDRMLAPLVAMIMVLTTQISFWNHYEMWVSKAIAVRRIIAEQHESVWKTDSEVLATIRDRPGFRDLKWNKRLPFAADLLELLRFPEVAMPIGSPEEIDRFLKMTGKDFPEYWVPASSGVFTEEAVAHRVAVLSTAKTLLVPKAVSGYFEPIDRTKYGEAWSRILSSLFVFPTHMRVVHEPFSTDTELIKALVPGYAVAGSFRNYLILVHESRPTPSVPNDR